MAWNSAEGWGTFWKRWESRLIVFGYDWLGRQFAFDRERVVGGEIQISILDPGAADLLEAPEGFQGFIETELIEYADAALALSFHNEWLKHGGEAPRPTQCVGYRRPLFVGGADMVDNLEITDLDVYVSLCGQLDMQTRGLAPGTPIKGFKV